MDELTLRRAAGAYRLSQAIYAMAELGIADHLADGPRSSAELATAVGASEPHLRRLLRALASEGILGETEDGRFTAGDVGALLVRGRGVREMVLGWSVLPASYEAFAKLATSVRSGHPAFELAHGMDFHAYLARHDAASAAYDAAVESTVSSFEAAAASYSFGEFELIVDVGGGGGGLLAAVLKRYARPRGILFDLPAVIDRVRATAPADPARSRIELVGGDFFEDATGG